MYLFPLMATFDSMSNYYSLKLKRYQDQVGLATRFSELTTK